jgi:diaminopimelate decarboxylase
MDRRTRELFRPRLCCAGPMAPTRDHRGTLFLAGVSLSALVLEVGTPAYAYDLDGMAAEAGALHGAFDAAPHLVAYAVKANTAGAVVRTLAGAGCGADVVSGAELLVALACGIAPDRIVFSGVGKQNDEIDRAIAAGIAALQVESLEEIPRLGARARAAGRKARVSVRVNPSVDLSGATHAHVATGHDAAKFGVWLDDVSRAIDLIEESPDLQLVGLATHVGSQFTSLDPYLDGARVLFDLARSLRDAGRLRSLAFLDTGGGFGVRYEDSANALTAGAGARPPRLSPADFVRATLAELRARRLEDTALYVEPGRALVAPHGVLLARVVQPKVTRGGRWLMIDAGMNDLLRPALYQARHEIVSIEERPGGGRAVPWRVAGPVCESSDDFGEHVLADPPPTAVAILDAGAYGYTMASRYNGRQLPVEVFLSGGRVVGRTQRASVASWAEERAVAGA